MKVIDEHDPEKTIWDTEFTNHLTYECAGGILANSFFKTSDSKWPNQLYGNIHLKPHSFSEDRI